MLPGALSSMEHAERGAMCQAPKEVGGIRMKVVKTIRISRRALYLKMADHNEI